MALGQARRGGRPNDLVTCSGRSHRMRRSTKVGRAVIHWHDMRRSPRIELVVQVTLVAAMFAAANLTA